MGGSVFVTKQRGVMSEEPQQQKVFPGVSLEDSQPEIPTVPESILRKKKSIETYKANKEARLLDIQKRKEKKKKQKIQFKRAEHIINNYRNLKKAEKLLENRRKKGEAVRVNKDDHKLLLVVRVKGKAGVTLDDRSKRILERFRLSKVNFARFLSLTDFTKKMIRQVEPFITYGYPTLKTVKDLIYKRGMTLQDGKPVSINNNQMIEEQLGEHNVICVEDIVHEIYNVGENFLKVNSFLCPFKLSPPKVIEGTRRVVVQEIPKSGNRKEDINEFIEPMN